MEPKPPIDVLKVDHVATAMWDLADAARFFRDVLGAEFVDGGDEHEAGFRWLQFALPGGKIELLEPLHRDGFLYRFLTRRGEGLHHVTLFVRDLESSIAALRAEGYEPIDINLAHEAWKEAYLSPRDAWGVLFQIAQVPDANAPTTPPRPLEEYLEERPGLRPD